uniref:Terpene synthase metal-binding domain-containing protein n=1 Tax=Oryza glumipatula TaxID=40148 RepID=A0A0D9Z6S9_9ORYZ
MAQFTEQSSFDNSIHVTHALKFPLYATLEPHEHRRNIERFKTNGFQLLKSGYCWVAEFRLEELKFARIMPLQALLTAVSPLFRSELSDARIAWSQNTVLVTAVDDLFDGGGSMEEMRNFVALIEKWDDHSEIGFCSKNVGILFNALYQTNSRICAKAALVQNRIVMDHIAEHWRLMVRAMMTEAEWASSKHIPATMEEYMSAASHSLVGTIFQSAAYLLGPRLPEEVVGGEEYGRLWRHTLLVSRLLNNVMTYGREPSRALALGDSVAGVRGGGQGGDREGHLGVEVGAAEAGVRRRRRGCSPVMQGDVLADE